MTYEEISRKIFIALYYTKEQKDGTLIDHYFDTMNLDVLSLDDDTDCVKLPIEGPCIIDGWSFFYNNSEIYTMRYNRRFDFYLDGVLSFYLPSITIEGVDIRRLIGKHKNLSLGWKEFGF